MPLGWPQPTLLAQPASLFQPLSMVALLLFTDNLPKHPYAQVSLRIRNTAL